MLFFVVWFNLQYYKHVTNVMTPQDRFHESSQSIPFKEAGTRHVVDNTVVDSLSEHFHPKRDVRDTCN